MKKYNIDVCGEEKYVFDIELSEEELQGVIKVLQQCNELGGYNDAFIVTEVESKEELLTWM